MFKKWTLPVAAALIAGTVMALAGNTTLFSSRLGDIVFPFTAPLRDGTAGAIDNMIIGATTPRAGTFTSLTADQVDASIGSYARDPASSTYYPTYTMANGQTLLVFTATGTTAYAYVILAAAPKDGDEACVFSAGAITALYVYANAGQSIVNAAATLAANARTCYRYSESNTTWYRSQ